MREEIEDYRRALLDAQVMFEMIRFNRDLPPTAETAQQYQAMGKAIKVLLAKYE